MARPPASPRAAPGSTSSLRAANQHRVLGVLRTASDKGTHTQAELARATGLAHATVSNIVRELSAAGLLHSEPSSGRRGSAVRLAPGAGVVAGIDFGHRHVAVAAGDLTGRVLAEDRVSCEPGGHEADLALASSIWQRINPGVGPLRHVGLGLPAPVVNNVVRSAAIFPGWEGVDAAAATAEVFGAPAHVENDANLGALAEHREGQARGHSAAVFVKIASGVGAGIVINDELFHGVDGTAGEIGHLTVDEQGPMCRCGSRGCLETYTSSEHLLRLLGSQLPGATFREVVVAAGEGNLAARRVIEDAGLRLGWALATVLNLLNPGIVILGGAAAQAGDLLLEPTRSGLRRHALDSVAETPIVASELGGRAGLVGAVHLAAERTDLVTP